MSLIDRAPSGDRVDLSTIVLALGAMLVVLVFLGTFLAFRIFSIPSGSNIPTLLIGDYVIGSKLAYGFSRYSFPVDLGFTGRVLGRPPHRGDVAIFALPRDPNVIYLKRVIGLPGDRVQMKEGRLYLNGTVVPREAVPNIQTAGYDGRLASVATYRETLPGGPSYTIIEIQGDTGFNDNTVEFLVPPGQYFTLGDNRDNSVDSRIGPDRGGVGMVPYENFISRAEYVLFHAGRADRTLIPVR